jgi:hypothetical protein
MSNKVYSIKFAEAHLEKIVSLMETQPFAEWKPIWISIQHQVALAKREEAAATPANDDATDATSRVEAAE